jgi:hypothetical protein
MLVMLQPTSAVENDKAKDLAIAALMHKELVQVFLRIILSTVVQDEQFCSGAVLPFAVTQSVGGD